MMFEYKSNGAYNMRSETRGDLVIPKVKLEMFKSSLASSGANIIMEYHPTLGSTGNLKPDFMLFTKVSDYSQILITHH